MRSNLVALRKGLGLTQPDFAKMFGLSASELCRIEKGQRKGSVDLWLGIADTFKLSLPELRKIMEVTELKN
ncbi:MAG: helix-turn-helix transcriptional regulator [Bacilli bacterium]|nr:helix-turn-helix transcriptional regulator [Bacilli bacterium]